MYTYSKLVDYTRDDNGNQRFRDAITYLASTVTNIVNSSTSYGIDYIYTYCKLVDYTRDDNGNQSTVVGYSAICYHG